MSIGLFVFKGAGTEDEDDEDDEKGGDNTGKYQGKENFECGQSLDKEIKQMYIWQFGWCLGYQHQPNIGDTGQI